MKSIPFLTLIAVLVTSGMVSAQYINCDHQDKSSDHYAVFHQTNSISHDFFHGYEYDDEFQNHRLVPYTQSLRYNRVDALFIGVGTDVTDPSFHHIDIYGITFDGFIGYSTGQKSFQYRASLTKDIGKYVRFGGEILNTTTTDDYWRTGLTENSITAFSAGYDYHDYYQAEGYGIFGEIELGNFMTLAAGYNYLDYSSMVNNTGYSLFKGGGLARINPALDTNSDAISHQSYNLSLGINDRGLTKSRVFTSKFLAEAEIGDTPVFGNEFSYNKYQITSLNYLKLDRSTLLKFRLMAGSVTGESPDFKDFALGGIGSLRASGYKFYRGNQMLMSNAEVIFGNIWQRDIGGLSIDGLYFSAFYDTGWTDYVVTTSNPLEGFSSFTPDQLTHNIGAGVGIGFIRLEVATPIAGSEGFTSFWLRLNPTF